MKRTTLGNTGISVCAAPLGAMYLGTKQGRDEAFAILDRYVAAGGDFIDTANIYAHWVGEVWKGGESETMLGEWFAARGNRDSLVVASKVGFGYPGVPDGLTKDLIKGECEKSLRRMGIETIDLYFAHQDDWSVPQEEVLAAFDELIREGKVRTIGASNFVTDRLATANLIAKTQGLPQYQVLQQRHTYLPTRTDANTAPQVVLTKDMNDYCVREGLTIMAYSATLGGAYTGDPARPVPPEYRNQANEERLSALKQVAAEVGASPQQVMLAWLWSKPNMIPLVAASSTAQLDANLAGMEIALSEEQIVRLDTAGA